MEAIFTPGMTAPAHRHSGPEAWFTLSGETCLETPDGTMVGRAGGPPVIVPGGPPMHLTATGTETRRALVLILHDSTQPPTTPAADWTPKGLCSSHDSATEATVRALDDQERRAALDHDYAALERLWSEHFLVNAPTNTILPNRSAVLEHFRKGMTTRSSYERSVEHVRVDGDIAIVMGAETLKPTDQAPFAGQTVQRRFTNIWKKEKDNQWRLWARHANWIAPPVAKP
jgi:ketosteroid isomerase-like protein